MKDGGFRGWPVSARDDGRTLVARLRLSGRRDRDRRRFWRGLWIFDVDVGEVGAAGALGLGSEGDWRRRGRGLGEILDADMTQVGAGALGPGGQLHRLRCGRERGILDVDVGEGLARSFRPGRDGHRRRRGLGRRVLEVGAADVGPGPFGGGCDRQRPQGPDCRRGRDADVGEGLARSFRPGRDGHRRRRRSPGCGGLEASGALALTLEAGGGLPALEGGFLPARWVGPEQGTPLSALDLGEDDGPADGVSGGSPAPASFPASSLHGGAGRRRPLAVPLLAGVSAPVCEVIEPARDPDPALGLLVVEAPLAEAVAVVLPAHGAAVLGVHPADDDVGVDVVRVPVDDDPVLALGEAEFLHAVCDGFADVFARGVVVGVPRPDVLPVGLFEPAAAARPTGLALEFGGVVDQLRPHALGLLGRGLYAVDVLRPLDALGREGAALVVVEVVEGRGGRRREADRLRHHRVSTFSTAARRFSTAV